MNTYGTTGRNHAQQHRNGARTVQEVRGRGVVPSAGSGGSQARLGRDPLAEDGPRRWAAVPGWPDYVLSDDGMLRHLEHLDRRGRPHRGALLRPVLTRWGGVYRLRPGVLPDAEHADRSVFALVAETFGVDVADALDPELRGAPSRHRHGRGYRRT